MKSLCNDAATHLHHNSEGKAGCVLLCAMHLAGWVPLTNTDLTSLTFPMVGSPCRMTASLHGCFSIVCRSRISLGRQANRLYSTDPLASENSVGSKAAMVLPGQNSWVQVRLATLLIRLSTTRSPCGLRQGAEARQVEQRRVITIQSASGSYYTQTLHVP